MGIIMTVLVPNVTARYKLNVKAIIRYSEAFLDVVDVCALYQRAVCHSRLLSK